MRYEKSCGIVPFHIINGEPFVVLVQQNNGEFGVPKGHVEGNETELETALRECKEEVDLSPRIVDGFREEISYHMMEFDTYKTVVFFMGVVDDLSFRKQESEIANILLVPIKEAMKTLTYDDTRNVLNKAKNFFDNNKSKFN